MSDINIVLENRDDIRVAVEEKDINVEVPAGKDGRALHPQGEWSASAAYAYLDLVSYQGSSYVATKAVPAGTLPTDTSYWMLSAEKGEPGGAEWGNITGDLSDQTDLQTALDAKAPVILNSASGSIASFSDGSASPVTALSVIIDPVQAGTGDPSPTNVRPISGHTQAVVTRTGKNLFDGVYQPWGIANDKIASTNGRTAIIAVKGGETYTIKKAAETNRFNIYETAITPAANVDVTTSSAIVVDTYTRRVTVGSTAKYLVVYVSTSTEQAEPQMQVELGSTATSYEPYQGTSVTIDLDGTRYGGELNVLTGEMTVDVMFKTLTGSNSEGWGITDAGTYKYFYLNRDYSSWTYSTYSEQALNADPRLKCNVGLVSYQTMSTVKGVALAYGYRVSLPNFLADNHTVAEFRTYLASNPIQIVIPLKNPQTVQLTPSQMQTLLGQNNIWVDTGDTSVTYRADTKLFVQGQIAQTAKVTRQMIADSATADGKAPKSLATDELIIVGDELRKATANIGQGSAITASNSTTATLADVIKALQ